jgi:omega-6 fatty acid desaturase (delta-12 desaturase)
MLQDSSVLDPSKLDLTPDERARSHPHGGLRQASDAKRAFWHDALAPCAQPDRARSALCLATSVVPYLALSALMYAALSISYVLTLLLAIPTAGFLIRTYIIFHDCAHGSFLRSKRANRWLGTTLGLLVFADFQSWKHNHASSSSVPSSLS